MEQNMKSNNPISNEEYFEVAKEFILDEVYNSYNDEEIIEYPDEDIEVLSQDANGRKIISLSSNHKHSPKYRQKCPNVI